MESHRYIDDCSGTDSSEILPASVTMVHSSEELFSGCQSLSTMSPARSISIEKSAVISTKRVTEISSKLGGRPCLHTARLWGIVRDNPWVWEISCLFVGFIFLSAAVTLLASINAQALSDWPLPIQPNSMISVFMAISKSALLAPVAECISQVKWIRFSSSSLPLSHFQRFDEASRGPWGSLKLLMRPVHFGRISVFASILTIGVLALDPFVHQILSCSTRTAPLGNGTATFATAQALADSDPLSLQASIVNGIYRLEDWPMEITCTTSNCEWTSPITTLGLCSECRDITSQVEVACETAPGPLEPENDEPWSFTTTNCTYVVEDIVSFNTYIQTLTLPGTGERETEYANQFTRAKLIPLSNDIDHLGNLFDDEPDWVVRIIAYATYFDISKPGMPRLTLERLKPEVNACGIYWCGQVYDTLEVRNGTLQTQAPSSIYKLRTVMHPGGLPHYIHTSEGRAEIRQVALEDRDSFPGNPYFMVDSEAMLDIKRFLRHLLNVTSVLGNDDFRVSPEEEHGILELLEAVLHNRNLPDTFARIAKSTTEQMRASSSHVLVNGMALGSETYMQVQWEWMTLPLVLFASATILLAATMAASSRGKVEAWKSSSLAALLHHIEGRGVEEGDLQSLSALKRMAESVHVGLRDGCFREIAPDVEAR
ncbi:hypothetical protein B0I35DRAFT_444082 [Stachybotrys elegans]|uniref:Uncharacterized protein n=1 Tax=Stachybotrys elegans TaxID=80388 RepID=A0A8K0SJC3_9HYPO|nr:hypothetical protein B0I35DRAFT_444082 [Stachybotrys elegans]